MSDLCQAAVQAGMNCSVTININTVTQGWQWVIGFGIFFVVVAIIAWAIAWNTKHG